LVWVPLPLPDVLATSGLLCAFPLLLYRSFDFP
jgi:hypothetical protein